MEDIMEEKYFVYEKAGKGRKDKKRSAVKLSCSQCGKEFLKAKHLLVEGQENYYCSKSCSGKSQKTSIEFTCAYCGKIFERRPSSKRNSRSGFYFCTRKCKDSAQRIYGNDNIIHEILPDHYTGTATIFNYRQIALLEYGEVCNRCGYNENLAAIMVHHIDRDHHNNSLDNLEVLCANCHAIEHFGEK
jgi:5-methylcytosine-specific restriction endonuclease McrA